MDFLKSILLGEARMKDAAMDLVYKAVDGTPTVSDHEKYLMKVVAKVLAIDKDKLFKGDAIAAEKMVKSVLGASPVKEAVLKEWYEGDDVFDYVVAVVVGGDLLIDWEGEHEDEEEELLKKAGFTDRKDIKANCEVIESEDDDIVKKLPKLAENYSLAYSQYIDGLTSVILSKKQINGTTAEKYSLPKDVEKLAKELDVDSDD